MVVSLDPVSGLPMLGTDSVIEQIPLGVQVFPFADLDATDRPRRAPLYGDDVIPTSALLVGMDSHNAPRAATMDTAQNLYTRDSQVTSFGTPLGDGEFGPIDVNVVAGSFGGSSGVGPYPVATIHNGQDNFSTWAISPGSFDTEDIFPPIHNVLKSIVVSLNILSYTATASNGDIVLILYPDGVVNPDEIWLFHTSVDRSGAALTTQAGHYTWQIDFGDGLDLQKTFPGYDTFKPNLSGATPYQFVLTTLWFGW